MTYLKCLLLCICCVSLTSCGQQAASSLAFSIYQAQLGNSPTPLVSDLDPAIDINKAYEVQKELMILYLPQNTIKGFNWQSPESVVLKTAPNKAFASGIFFENDKMDISEPIYTSLFLSPYLEFKWALELNDFIDTKVSSVDSLKAKVSTIYPIIDIIDNSFDVSSTLQLEDVIAANLSHEYYISSDVLQLEASDSTAQATFSKDGNRIIQMDQTKMWEYALELVNHLIDNDFTLRDQQLLITPVYKKSIKMTSGDYLLKTREDKVLSFTVVE